MSQLAKILIFAGVLITLAQITGGIRKMENLARGLRNKNPLNIRKTDIKWNGKIDGEDKSFETFVSPEYGIRAGAKLLINYQDKHDLNTVEEIINRFAPPHENDTNSYAQHVADEIGVGLNEPIDVTDHLHTMIKTMIKHENGVNPYSDDLIATGIAMV